jgi:hypothetical protein
VKIVNNATKGPGPMKLLTLTLAFLAVAFTARPVQAECKALPGGALVYKCGERVSFQPAVAAGWQLNLRRLIDDGFSDAAYQRVALMAGYTLTYHGEKVTWGTGLFGGVGLNQGQPNAPQASVALTLSDRWALMLGAQRLPGGVYQGLVTIATGLTLGKDAATSLRELAAVCVGAVCGL